MISIIMPAYNVEKYVGKCLDSILDQTYTDFEVIIINDGSKDGTLKICKKYSETDSRVTIINQSNKGVSAARNKGLDIARGEYICFVDSDDYIDQKYLEIMHRNITSSRADISICKYSQNEISNKKNSNDKEIWNTEQTFYQLIQYRKVGGEVFCKLFNREVIRNIRFNEKIRLGEDQIFVIQAIGQSNIVIFHDISLYSYMYRESSAMHTEIDERYWDAVCRAEWISEEVSKRYPKLAGLFRKEEISIYLYLVIVGFKSGTEEANKILHYVFPMIKNSSLLEYKRYSNNMDVLRYILVKYFPHITKAIILKKCKKTNKPILE